MAARLQPAGQRIRKMQRGDVPAVQAIENEAYEFGWTAGIFRDCLLTGHECWLLEAAEGLVGYGVLAIQADEAHLLNLCVAPECQGLGFGQRLLRRMIDVARWHATQRVLLEVRPSNRSALHIYRRHDFTVIGKRPRYYPAHEGREDALVMALPLRDPGGRDA